MACMKELYLTLNVQTFGGNFLLSTKYVHFKGKLEQVVFSNIYWTPPTGWIHAVGRLLCEILHSWIIDWTKS